jgi:hypothetical protein
LHGGSCSCEVIRGKLPTTEIRAPWGRCIHHRRETMPAGFAGQRHEPPESSRGPDGVRNEASRIIGNCVNLYRRLWCCELHCRVCRDGSSAHRWHLPGGSSARQARKSPANVTLKYPHSADCTSVFCSHWSAVKTVTQAQLEDVGCSCNENTAVLTLLGLDLITVYRSATW